MSQRRRTGSWTNEAMDDAYVIYTTTTHAWRTRAKTDDDVLRQARLAKIINPVLSEALGTRRQHHRSQIGLSKLWSAIWNSYLLSEK